MDGSMSDSASILDTCNAKLRQKPVLCLQIRLGAELVVQLMGQSPVVWGFRNLCILDGRQRHGLLLQRVKYGA